jgi:hypothetical protein
VECKPEAFHNWPALEGWQTEQKGATLGNLRKPC